MTAEKPFSIACQSSLLRHGEGETQKILKFPGRFAFLLVHPNFVKVLRIFCTYNADFSAPTRIYWARTTCRTLSSAMKVTARIGNVPLVNVRLRLRLPSPTEPPTTHRASAFMSAHSVALALSRCQGGSLAAGHEQASDVDATRADTDERASVNAIPGAAAAILWS